MLPHFLNAAAWVCLVQWPWGSLLLPSLIVLSLSHLFLPFWSVWRRSGIVSGPLMMFATDGAFLYLAWTGECWGELTVVFAPLLLGASLVSLLYSVAVMKLFSQRQKKK